MEHTRAVILAGGEGSRLGTLTEKRTKPAVPFAGKYRIIDFPLSNCVNSGIFDVMILAQYRPHSLIEHIGAGGPWDLNRDFTGGVRIYTPYRGRGASDWYLGTADAVQQNYRFIKQTSPGHVLILSGDHIYTMNYAALLRFHEDNQADLTMATIEVSSEEASRFGIVGIDNTSRVTSFVEKPEYPPSNLANMGVYLFNANILSEALWEDHLSSSSSHDFGKDILPALIKAQKRVFAFPYQGYWVDVGTLQSYWSAHMDLIKEKPRIDLNNRKWVIHTRTEERPPVKFSRGSTIVDSMITDGCEISTNAQIVRSIIAPGVRIGEGVQIFESIILTDCVINAGASIEHAILDKRVIVGENTHIGARTDSAAPTLTTIGKNATLPANLTIEPGAVIATDVSPDDFSSDMVRKDELIQTKRQPNEI